MSSRASRARARAAVFLLVRNVQNPQVLGVPAELVKASESVWELAGHVEDVEEGVRPEAVKEGGSVLRRARGAGSPTGLTLRLEW